MQLKDTQISGKLHSNESRSIHKALNRSKEKKVSLAFLMPENLFSVSALFSTEKLTFRNDLSVLETSHKSFNRPKVCHANMTQESLREEVAFKFSPRREITYEIFPISLFLRKTREKEKKENSQKRLKKNQL